MDDELKDQLVGSFCVCHNVGYDEIDALVCNAEIKNIDKLKTMIVVCSNCERCKPDIQKIIDYHKT